MASLRIVLALLLLWQAAGTCAWAKEIKVVKSIEIIGLKRTDQRTVLRELPFAVGDQWRADFADIGERRLRNLGIFSEARIHPPDQEGRVRIDLRERWSLWLLPQASRSDRGATSAGVALDEYNLWGLRHHLHLAYREDTGKNFSTTNGASYDFGYKWRRVNDSRLDFHFSASSGSSVFDAYQNGMLVAEYLQHQQSITMDFSYALGDVPGEGWAVSGGVSGSNRRLTFRDGLPQPLIPAERARSFFGTISFQDLDDHITWLSGSAFAYSLSITTPRLGSTFKLYRQVASARSYIPLHGPNTFNLRLDVGHAAGDVANRPFDLGNRDTLRGYYPGEVQGKAYVLGSIEGRYLLQPDSNVQLVAFSDMAYVASNASTVNRVYIGMGGGIRWTLRWLAGGMIRGDVAYGLATRRWRFYLGTGQAF